MNVYEMESGTTFNEGEIEDITEEIITVLSKNELLVCDAKEMLDITKQKIDRKARLQI